MNNRTMLPALKNNAAAGPVKIELLKDARQLLLQTELFILFVCLFVCLFACLFSQKMKVKL